MQNHSWSPEVDCPDCLDNEAKVHESVEKKIAEKRAERAETVRQRMPVLWRG